MQLLARQEDCQGHAGELAMAILNYRCPNTGDEAGTKLSWKVTSTVQYDR